MEDKNLVEEKKNQGNNKAALVAATVLFLLIIGLCVYIAVSLSRILPQSGQEDKEYESQTGDPWKELLGDEYDENGQEEGTYASDNVHLYPNHSKEEFEGPYYPEVSDCMDETVSYKLKRELYDYEDRDEDVYIYTSYIQLEGDIPGVNEINRVLKEETVYFVNNYEKNKDEILEMLGESGRGIRAQIKSYVTYNTEEIISVVVHEEVEMGYAYKDVNLYCFNIDPVTGTILDNTDILECGEGFGKEFRARSNAQNGISEGGTDAFSDAEIEAMLNDENSLILFYTPLGIELGYNYRSDSYAGWITITMQDYESLMTCE